MQSHTYVRRRWASILLCAVLPWLAPGCSDDSDQPSPSPNTDTAIHMSDAESAEPDGQTNEPSDQPAPNPYLAESAWPITHGSSASQSSSTRPGLEGESFVVEHVPVGLPSITLAFEPSGEMFWAANPLEVYRARVANPPEVVSKLTVTTTLGDLFSGAYTMLDRDGRFYTSNEAGIRVYEPDGPEGISVVGEYLIDSPAEGETVRGIGMTFDGVLLSVSSAGRLLAIDRSTLQLVSELDLDSEVSNSMATDEDGGVYVVTADAMHRVQWTGTALSLDPNDGAWTATYEAGELDVEGGRLGVGSGSTPSLMTVGDDKLVIITDGQPLMHLVAFWRDAIPDGWNAPEGADPRTAGIIPVTFGDPTAASSLSEQSVLVMGNGAVVVNNDYGDFEGFEPILQGIAPPGIEKFVWNEEANTLTSAWSIDDISCPNGIPSASRASGNMYCIGKRGDIWTVEAIDWDAGTPAFHVEMGEGNDFNSVYAATEIGPDGAIWTGTLTGLVRVRAAN